jgi:hypothetical protein
MTLPDGQRRPLTGTTQQTDDFNATSTSGFAT